jgi:hypothetical protein
MSKHDAWKTGQDLARQNKGLPVPTRVPHQVRESLVSGFFSAKKPR